MYTHSIYYKYDNYVLFTMKVKAKIQKWGNGLALRVSGPMRDVPKFKEGSVVEVEVSEEGLVIKKNKVSLFPFTEEEILADLTPESAHADLVINPIGKEFDY